MNRKIHHYKTLLYYDGPELFVAKDQLQTNFLCSLVEAGGEMERFFCIPISSSRLANIMLGLFDIHEAFSAPESGEFFFADLIGAESEEIDLKLITKEEIPEGWIPDPGFFLDHEDLPTEDVSREAWERNSAVVHLSLNPPESREGLQINADTLARAVSVFQGLVKWAYKKAVSSLSPQTKKLLSDDPYNYGLEVVGFSPGSFNVHFKSNMMADLAGDLEISRAFKKIDEIVSPIQDIEKVIEVLKKNKGHLVNSFRNILSFIIETNSPITYKWSTPQLKETRSKTITKEMAIPLYNLLVEMESIGSEYLEIFGYVEKADCPKGIWSLVEIETKKHFSGKVDVKRNVNLAGITLETKKYKFNCEERLEQEVFSGKEKPHLFLISYEEC